MTLGKERGSEDTLGVRMKGESFLVVFKELSGQKVAQIEDPGSLRL